MSAGRARAFLTLARWLGPWADEQATPAGVVREEVPIPPREPGDRRLRAWHYRPAPGRACGALFLVPGLHFEGPADPRFSRFAAILARAGIEVFTPFLPDFLDLLVAPSAWRDTERAFDAMLASPWLPRGARPGVFSISFGDCVSIRLAAERPAQAAALVVFGGFADFERALRFAVTGVEPGAPGLGWDPVNQPAAFLNLLPDLDGRPADTRALQAAWRTFIQRSWGRPEGRSEGARRRLGAELAALLPEPQRALFLTGCGLSADTAAQLQAAVERARGRFSWADPRPHLARVSCPITLVHGADDDVIPVTHVHELRAALPADATAQTLITGLFGHTGSPGVRELLSRAPAAVQEAATLIRILRAIVDAATVGFRSARG